LTEDFRKKWVEWVRLNRFPSFHRGLQVAFTFFLFCFTLIIFRAKSLSDAYYVMTHLWTGLGNLAGIRMSLKSLYGVGLDRYELIIAFISIGLMEFIQMIEKQSKMRQMFSERPILARWTIYYVLILFLIFFGEYNDHAFIYFQF
jgi:alginate O-acetyltransferase complex protein AlgI